MGRNKITDAIKEGHFIKSGMNYIGKRLLSKEYRYTKSMNYAPDDIKPQISGNDYVRIASLELMAKEIGRNEVSGNVAELGVYRGEFASLINSAFPTRKLYLFDTFEGFSKEDIKKEVAEKYSSGEQDFSDTSVEMVLGKMEYRENCIVRKGWFPKTAVGLEDERFAFVSIDADLFEPIYEGLVFFYPRLQQGGAIFIHDFNNREYKGSAQAVRKYSRERGVPYFLLPDECGSAVILK